MAEGICTDVELPEMSLFLLQLWLWLMLCMAASPKEFVGGDDTDVAADVEAENVDNAQFRGDEVDGDEGVNIRLVSVCGATKEAH